MTRLSFRVSPGFPRHRRPSTGRSAVLLVAALGAVFAAVAVIGVIGVVLTILICGAP